MGEKNSVSGETIETKPHEQEKPLSAGSVIIPAQYQGMDSESMDFIWTVPEYTDPEKTKSERERKSAVLAMVRAQEERMRSDQEKISELRDELHIPEPFRQDSFDVKEKVPTLSIDERKKLHGWAASYELAKIAKQQGVDLSKISREEYVDFAIQNSLTIDDDQLRVAPWQRMGTSVQEIVLANREKKAEITDEAEKAFVKFCYETQEKARQENRIINEGVRVRQGTKDSNSWLFFAINKGAEFGAGETFKSYLSVKDLNTLTPERFTKFMTTLQQAGYNGDIKIFQDLSEQGVRLNDQIVMHGGSEIDAKLALEVAEQFFGQDIDQTSFGRDEVIDGENKSYSQILAKKIADSINPPTTKN